MGHKGKQGKSVGMRRTGRTQPQTEQGHAFGQKPVAGQEADVSSKRIFGNHTLCAQFLRDYAGLPMLANVQPEDIEDVSERYHLFREVEFQSDTVKKVHVREQADGEPKDIYILSLIEHKSEVDHDVTMQILKYMVCIWENDVMEQEQAERKAADRGAGQGGSREPVKDGEANRSRELYRSRVCGGSTDQSGSGAYDEDNGRGRNRERGRRKNGKRKEPAEDTEKQKERLPLPADLPDRVL